MKRCLTAQVTSVAICGILTMGSGGSVSASPRLRVSASQDRPPVSVSNGHEYLWYEAENMRGITETSRHEPLLNPSYL